MKAFNETSRADINKNNSLLLNGLGLKSLLNPITRLYRVTV